MTDEESENLTSKLFATDENGYSKNYKQHLLEQYKLCVKMADEVSSRRSNANNFFLTLNTLLITAIGILAKLGSSFIAFNFWWIVISSFAGVLFCICWFSCIRSYKELNEAKFKVINLVEKKLPVAAFKVEWDYLTKGKKTVKYPHLTRIERWVPVVFVVLYAVLIGITLTLAFFGDSKEIWV